MFSSSADVRLAVAPQGSGSGGVNAPSPLNDIPESQLQDAIKQADSLIVQYVGRRYQVPLDEDSLAVSPVRYWSRDIAAYLALLVWMGRKELPTRDPVQIRYDLAMESLQKVYSGEMDLPFPASVYQAAVTADIDPLNPTDVQLTNNVLTTSVPYAEQPYAKRF